MIDAFISNYNSLRNTSQLLVKLLFILPSFDMILYYINSNINKKRNTAITFLNNYVTAVIDDMVLSITMAESSSVNKLVQSNVEATLFSLVSSKQLLQLSAKFNAVPSVSNTQSSRVLNLLKQL